MHQCFLFNNCASMLEKGFVMFMADQQVGYNWTVIAADRTIHNPTQLRTRAVFIISTNTWVGWLPTRPTQPVATNSHRPRTESLDIGYYVEVLALW